MNKLGISGMKSLNQLRSLSGSISGSGGGKTVPSMSSYRSSSSDSVSLGSFANLKLTAEKLVKEQASVKTDLEMANSKLKRAVDHIHLLEEKLQNAVNENAKLQVKQKEEAKLWKGLESKFSSTKTLCDQLTETLQHLAGQVRDAEHDKKVFEDKFLASSEAFDSLQLQMTGLTLKIDSTEENMRKCEESLSELKIEKEEREKFYVNEQGRTANLIGEKDAQIKDLERAVAADSLCLDNLNTRLEEVQRDLRLKEDMCKCLEDARSNLEKEKGALQSNNEHYARRLLASGQEIKDLQVLVHDLVEKLIELDQQSAMVSDNVAQLNRSFDTCYKLAKQEKDLTANLSQLQSNHLHKQLVNVKSENDSLQLDNEELKSKSVELQKLQELLILHHAEENRSAEERIKKMESEAEGLILKKTELEMLLTNMEERIKQLSEESELAENKMRELSQNISTLESESRYIQDKLQVKLQGKSEETEGLQKVIVEHEEHVASLENQVSELRVNLEEKEQLHQHYIEKEKLLEDKKKEIQASLAAAESTLAETKKQYDVMLESKQLELSKHLKEISQRNDQAVNDIRRKFELEKLDIVNQEKQKVDRLVGEMESQCAEKLAESKEESRQSLMQAQEQHASLISRLRQDYDKKEKDLRDDHEEELKHVQLQAEDELQEKTRVLKEEHDLELKVLKCQHEDECRKLQEELGHQKSREERQRALLQMQWKALDGNPKEDQEVTSKKFIRLTQTPVSSALRKVEKENAGNVMNIPKHSRKVTRREYEVETTNGGITKRKTKSTVMFEDPTKLKRVATPRSRAIKDAMKVKEVYKGGSQTRPSNIGDLFSEGSLNPYVDDPYAFD
ncbi:synaptonemal complex protein 1-like isoform X2 [Papaver somniferum]|uniref:synaptonemal complex protein 1-like isoform X2 n=1 Tax=Papaver somniferum TaxID=3469 RepID=UPI000E6F784D|nr:synaptonemal complex protein 1-like isoform X2 [Papaver somniferum]